MENNVLALRALYVALGGDEADVANLTLNSEVISAIATLVQGATLPAVTAADDGKILKVVDGAWAAAES